MKSKLLLFFSCLAMGALVACDGLGGLVPDGGGSNGDSSGQQGGGSNGDSSGQQGGGINLPDTMEQAFNKFYQLGKEQGFEVTFNSIGEDDSGQTVRESDTVGFKNDVLWIQGESAYKELNSGLEYYQYDTQKQSYEYQGSVQHPLQTIAQQFTSQFYAGYQYVSSAQGSLTDVKDVTVAGRAAKEYTFVYTALDAVGTLKLVFDNQTGITLKIYGTAATGSETSSAEFEVTSFKVGGQVTVPTLHKDNGGGQGGEGGGGQQDVDYFSNKLLIYASNQSANMYANSQLALFDDGKFELSFYDGGYLVVKLGEYSVGSNKSVAALSVKKVYKDRGQEYSTMNESLTLTYADGGYTLQVSASGKVNYLASGQPPVHADIPEEGGQTGEDAKYKVTETQWNAIVVNRGIVSLTSNLTVVTSDSTGQTKYEFDNGKIHYLFESSTFTTEMYYEFTSENSGYVYYKSNNVWSKQAAPGDLHALFDGYVGILQVPYNKVSFNSSSHYYGCNSWTIVDSGGSQDSYQNLRFYFEQGNLIKTTYKHWNDDCQYDYSKYGQTSVTLPQTGGQTDPNARYKVTSQVYEGMIIDGGLVGLDSNFTAMVTTSDNQQGYTKYEFDEGNIRVFTVDAGGTTNEYYTEYTNTQNGYKYYKNESGVWVKETTTFGIGTYLNSLGILPIPFSSLTFNESTREYDLASWTNNYGTQYTNIHFSFDNDKLQKMRYQGPYAAFEVEFNKYGSTSVTLPEVGGGQQQQSKWPAEDIANKLAALGFNLTVPEPDIDDEYIVSVTDVVSADNTSLLITITLTDATYSAVVFSSFVSGFQDKFTLDYMSSDIENGIYVFVNEAKDTVLTMTYSRTSPVVTLLISQYTGSPYPAEAIAAFIESNNLTTPFPSLAMDDVSYSFMSGEGEAGLLKMDPLGENTNAKIMAKAKEALVRGGFKVCYMPMEDGAFMDLYIDPEVEYYVSFREYDGALYATISIGGEEMAAAVDLEYPTEKITALTPEDLDDVVPSLAIDGALYMIGEDGNGFQLQIHVQPGMDAESILSSLQTRVGRSGYEFVDNGYYSTNNQIAIYFNNCYNRIIEIQVRFVEPEEPADVTYTLVSDNDWDITVDDAVIYAYMWKANGEYQWVELTPEKAEDDTINFTLETDSSWVGMKIVRFSPESEIAWKYGPEGSVNEKVIIWNETGDIELNGKGGDIRFTFPR